MHTHCSAVRVICSYEAHSVVDRGDRLVVPDGMVGKSEQSDVVVRER